jgi:hypothetical protein
MAKDDFRDTYIDMLPASDIDEADVRAEKGSSILGGIEFEPISDEEAEAIQKRASADPTEGLVSRIAPEGTGPHVATYKGDVNVPEMLMVEGQTRPLEQGQVYQTLPETQITGDPEGSTGPVQDPKADPEDARTVVQWEEQGGGQDYSGEPIGQGEAFVEGVAQVGSMGWLDELAGKLAERSGMDYEQARQAAQDYAQRVQQEQGGMRSIGQAAGFGGLMALPGAGELAAARGAGTAGRAAAAAAEGAGIGATIGAGEAEPEQRAGGALAGALSGAAGGAAGTAVARGAGKAGGALARTMRKGAQKQAGKAAARRVAAAKPAGGLSARDLQNIDETFPGGREGAARAARESGIQFDPEAGPVQRKLQSGFSTPEDIGQRAERVRRSAGQEIGNILRQGSRHAAGERGLRESASGGVVSKQNLIKRIQDEVITPLERSPQTEDTAAARNMAKRLKNLDQQYGEELDLEEVQKLKRSFDQAAKHNRRGGGNLSARQGAVVDAARVVRSEQENAMERLAQDIGEPELLERYRKAKRNYAIADRMSEMASEDEAREASRRAISPSDYFAAGLGGAAGFGGDMMAGGDGGMSMTGMALAAGANRFYRRRENPIAASVNETISGILEKSPEKLGKFAPMLQRAAQRGPAALAARHYALSKKDPQYRQMVRQAQQQQSEGEEQ